MTITLTHKIYAALIAVSAISAGIAAGSMWSNHKIAKLERSVAAAKQNADIIESGSRDLEQKAAEYIQKIEYLETSLSEIQTLARKQDEKLKELATGTNAARDGVRRARTVRTIESTNTELCIKLAELGHACE